MNEYIVSILLKNQHDSDCLTICRVPGQNEEDAFTNAMIDESAMKNLKSGWFYVMHVIMEVI